jgi:hypothetical protein
VFICNGKGRGIGSSKDIDTKLLTCLCTSGAQLDLEDRQGWSMSNMQQSSMSHDSNHHPWSMINSLDFHPSPGLLTALEEDSMFQPLVSISLSQLFRNAFLLAPSSAPNSHARERQRVY